MAHFLDVAEYIVEKIGKTSTWKLQKLVYYSQAWHAVWEDRPLFDARIEAWANGPVVPALYEVHKGAFEIERVKGGDSNRLAPNERESIDLVIDHYGRMNGQELSDLTHAEDPWLIARGDLGPGVRSTNEITLESMVEYYTSLS